MSSPGFDGQVVLGWKVNSVRDPEYWRDSTAKPGAAEQEKFLVRLPAENLASHTAIIAQSGSGKSFFLGRLVEELILRTKSRCLILDPNADFKRIDQVEDASLWSEARYDPVSRRGKLPHESSREEFLKQWSKIAIQVRGNDPPVGNYKPLRLWLPSLSMDFFGEDLDPMLRSDLYHCHAFVQSVDDLWAYNTKERDIDLVTEAQKLLKRARTSPSDKLRIELEGEFLPDKTASEGSSEISAWSWLKAKNTFVKAIEQWRRTKVHNAIERIVSTPEYISNEVERFYFGKIREFMATRILETRLASRISSREANRIQVIDLPSLPKSTRLLAINAALNAEWEEAQKAWNNALKNPQNEDTRVPTFVVVDEAHNLIPLSPQSKAEAALRDQFRTIVAEGRKYGLFLLIVSQRPDKLDPLVVSECENKAVMRLGSGSVLDLTRRMLGLEDFAPKLTEKCLEFETGRVLLVGPWSPEPQIIYGAARRTIEGGRNLRSKYWATPAEEEKKEPESPNKH